MKIRWKVKNKQKPSCRPSTKCYSFVVRDVWMMIQCFSIPNFVEWMSRGILRARRYGLCPWPVAATWSATQSITSPIEPPCQIGSSSKTKQGITEFVAEWHIHKSPNITEGKKATWPAVAHLCACIRQFVPFAIGIDKKIIRNNCVCHCSF